MGPLKELDLQVLQGRVFGFHSELCAESSFKTKTFSNFCCILIGSMLPRFVSEDVPIVEVPFISLTTNANLAMHPRPG